MRVIFQDVDGPLIPGRMYYNRGGHYSTEHNAFLYDPVAVGMLRELCRKYDAKIVYNTAHNETEPSWMHYKARVNGMEDLLHDDCRTEFRVSIYKKLDAIVEWLRRHPEVTEWINIDDEPVCLDTGRQIQVNFGVGMSIDNFYQACELFGDKQSGLILAKAK